MIHLKITCHGVMAFVPSIDDKHMAAFLPKVPGKIVRDQRAFVRFSLDHYSAANKRSIDGSKGLQGHVLFDRERISVVGRVVAADAELRVDRFNDPRSPMPTGRDHNSLIWMPDAETLNPNHGELKAAYFNDPVGVEPGLLARLDFTQGRLGTAGVEKIQVPFRGIMRSEEKRPMAREIVVEMDIDSDHFFLRSDPFEGGRDPARDLRFEGEGDVELFIGNEPASDMYDETPPIDPIDVIDKAAREEFVFYNSLCESPSPDPLLPHFAARPGRETGCSNKTYKRTNDVKTSFILPFGDERLLSLRKDSSPNLKGGSPKWSVFSFIATDNNLRKAGELDLAEMEKADPSKVSVIAQIDLPGSSTQRFVVGNNERTPLGEELGNVNSGDPKELTAFLDICKSTRPAENTAIFILSHGTGLIDFKHKGTGGARSTPVPVDIDFDDLFNRASSIRGFSQRRKLITALHNLSTGIDDTSRDSLDNLELEAGIRNALKREGPFSIIGIDACLMGLVEIAYQMRFCGRYFVASQEDLAPDGWPYADVLNALNDQVSPRDAAIEIVKIYGNASKTQKGATLSAIDLNAMPQLASALDDLGGALLGNVAEDIDQLAVARAEARFFADYDYIDLCGFATALTARFKDRPSINSAAGAVIEQLGRGVLQTNVEFKVSRAGGLSTYLPNAPVVPEYHELAISKDAPRWHDFVVAYGNQF